MADNEIFSVENPSPCPLDLWSIEETEDDIKVANIFPYIGSGAGEGLFFAQIRSKIKYDSLERNEDSEAVINGLKFEFEDAVRKSSQRREAEEPEPYLLATYSFDQIDSSDFNEDTGVIPKGDLQVESFPPEIPQIINLKNNSLIQGSYLGETVSYFNIANTQYEISISTNWKNAPHNWEGATKLTIINNNGEEIYSDKKTGLMSITYIIPLDKYDNEGKLITYTIKYQIFTDNTESYIDDNWSVYISNYKINYENEIKKINIINTYNKINYYTSGNHTISVKKKFNQDNFINPSAFISYMKGTNATAGADPIKDWETFLNTRGYINNLKEENEIAFFLAEFTYDNENFGGECFTIIPYFTIVIKKSNNISVNTFEIIATPPEGGLPNPLSPDMEEGPWNDENLIWPYYSKIKSNSQGQDPLGTASTKLFARKGCYKDLIADVFKEWNNDNDNEVLERYWDLGNQPQETEWTRTCIPYIGEPTNKDLLYFEIINSRISNSAPLIYDLEGTPKLLNFCIFMIDDNMADAAEVLDIVPYYYKVKITEPINLTSQNKIGKMAATLVFNDKSQNYWDFSPASEIELNYHAHTLFTSPGYFTAFDDSPLTYTVKTGLILDAIESVQDVSSWINENEPNNKKEIFVN